MKKGMTLNYLTPIQLLGAGRIATKGRDLSVGYAMSFLKSMEIPSRRL